MSLSQYHLLNRLWNWNNLRGFLFFARKYTSKSGPRRLHQNDLVDVYNEYMLQEKSNKWNEFLFKLTAMNPVSGNHLIDNHANKELFENYTKEELVLKILDYIRENDMNSFISVLKFCEEKSVSLPSGLMLNLLKLLAKSGHEEGFNLMLAYYRKVYETEFNKKYGFKYFLAQLLWYTGNAEKSLGILQDFYKDNVLIHEVNCVVYDIICNTVTKRGEASLVLIMDFTQTLVSNYEYYYPMAVLWKHLNNSDWFADHQLAEAILNKNNELLNVITPLIPLWCAQCIQYHKIDVVHRMSEVLLKYNSLQYYSSVLHDLFDYYYGQQNLKRCSAVVKSALDLQIPLKESYQKRFVVLLTTGKPEKSNKSSITLPKRIEYQINLKF